MTNKALIVLRLLLSECEVKMGGRTYMLFPPDSEDSKYRIGVKCEVWRGGKKFNSDKPDIEWHKAHEFEGLESFINECQLLNDDELFLEAASMALTDINRSRDIGS